jgi:hypothetical protein
MEQMMERTLEQMEFFEANMDANQEMAAREAKTEVNLKERKEKIRTNRAKAEANHEKIMAK